MSAKGHRERRERARVLREEGWLLYRSMYPWAIHVRYQPEVPGLEAEGWYVEQGRLVAPGPAVVEHYASGRQALARAHTLASSQRVRVRVKPLSKVLDPNRELLSPLSDPTVFAVTVGNTVIDWAWSHGNAMNTARRVAQLDVGPTYLDGVARKVLAKEKGHA